VNQLVARRLLEKMGCSVTVAATGLEALEAFEQESFDLIFMDCHMPIMDGLTATRRIRMSGPKGEAIPVIALTADVWAQSMEQCANAGMSDFLSKPIQPLLLSRKLDVWRASIADGRVMNLLQPDLPPSIPLPLGAVLKTSR
jgi:CheY-like chemotaxis protein